MVQRCGTSHNALAILGLAGISLRLPWWNVVWNVYGSFRFTMQTLCSRRTERAAFARRALVWGFMGCSPVWLYRWRALRLGSADLLEDRRCSSHPRRIYCTGVVWRREDRKSVV